MAREMTLSSPPLPLPARETWPACRRRVGVARSDEQGSCGRCRKGVARFGDQGGVGAADVGRGDVEKLEMNRYIV